MTVNSDDPSYFGGYLNENYRAIQRAPDVERDHLLRIARNSFETSFLSTPEIAALIVRFHDYAAGQGALRERTT